jgi:hypothetical protein
MTLGGVVVHPAASPRRYMAVVHPTPVPPVYIVAALVL